MAIIHCSNIKCKYCSDKYKCTNKKVELNFMGINTTNQGFQELLKCTSFEESDLYRQAKIMITDELDSELELMKNLMYKKEKLKEKEK